MFVQLNILIIALVFGFLSVVVCNRQQGPTSNEINSEDIPDQESWNATLTTTNMGVVASRINYVHMQKFSKRRQTRFLDGVEIELFDAQGSPTSKVYANEAAFEDGHRDLTMIGNVRVQSRDGFRLNTEKLTWSDFNNKIASDEFVTVITAEGDTINGVGFESDKFLKNWSIKKPWGSTQGKLDLQQ